MKTGGQKYSLKVEGFPARMGGLESLLLCIIIFLGGGGGGVKKVHYGLCENYGYKTWTIPVDLLLWTITNFWT